MNDLKFTTAGDYMKGNQTFLTSDTHYCHDNILKFTDSNGDRIRGNRFSKVGEMNEAMFNGWSETIRENDTVYHLGDVAFGRTYYDDLNFIDTFRSLPGKKILIAGNHDDISWISKEKLFDEIHVYKDLRDQNFLLTHIPIHPSSLRMNKNGEKKTNIHGHIHQAKSPTKSHRNVSVEWTDYKPIHVDEVMDLNNYITYKQ